jgi:hypothetical protein
VTQLNFSAFLFHRLMALKSRDGEQEKACSRILELHLADPRMLPPAFATAAFSAAGNQGWHRSFRFLEKLRDRALDGPRPGEALAKIGTVTDGAGLERMARRGRQEGGLGDGAAQAPVSRRVSAGARGPVESGPPEGKRPTCSRSLPRSIPRGPAPHAGATSRRTAVRLRGRPSSSCGTAARNWSRSGSGPSSRPALDDDEGSQARSEAIEALVPSNKPHRFPDQAIDEALEKILATTPVDKGFRYEVTHAAEALALRRGARGLRRRVRQVGGDKDTFLSTYFLRRPRSLIPQASAEQRGRHLEFMKGHLKATN